MEYLQYKVAQAWNGSQLMCFKPYYKWNTFNT